MIFFFLMFKDFFVEERKILSSKKQKEVFLDFLKIFSLKNEGFGVLKNKKGFFFI